MEVIDPAEIPNVEKLGNPETLILDFEFKAGSIPLLVSMPHVGADIPDYIAARLSPCALAKADTDWHLAELYGFLGEMGAATIAARWSRYVIDVNGQEKAIFPGVRTTAKTDQ